MKEILALPEGELVDRLTPGERLSEVADSIAAFDPAAALDGAAQAGLEGVCRHDSRYPGPLRGQSDGPPVLWIRGSAARFAELLDGPAVAIVGSRRASAYGLEVAEELGRGLSAAGVTVVSGMALGIDGAAHRGALRSAEPRTVAFLGSGADVAYPRAHRRLHQEITEVGAVASEVAPGRRPFRWTFPARNRLMAAVTAVTVVVEAGNPSGSLITARFALDFNRTVGAVPGRVTAAGAAGTNKLLRDGASVIRHAGDVLDEVFGVAGSDRLVSEAEGLVDALSERERAVLALVEDGQGSGAIAEVACLPPNEVRIALGVLETMGLIARTGIGSYERRATRHP